MPSDRTRIQSSSVAWSNVTSPLIRSGTTVVPASGIRSRSAAGTPGRGAAVAAPTVVAEGLPAGLRRLAPGVELLGRAVAAVRAALGEESLGVRPVDLEPAGLAEVPTVRAVVLGTLVVPVETEPGHRVEDLVDRLVRRPVAIGVLDPEEEGPAGDGGRRAS